VQNAIGLHVLKECMVENKDPKMNHRAKDPNNVGGNKIDEEDSRAK